MHHKLQFWRAALLSALTFAAALLATGQQERPSDPQGALANTFVANKTSSIEVIGLYKIVPENPQSAYKLVMRNNCSKAIAAYSIGFNEQTSVRSESASDDHLIPTGSEFSIHVDSDRNVTLQYVVFEDGSIEGDAAGAAGLIERRRGQLEQYERIQALLNAALRSHDLEWLLSALRQLPDKAPEGRSLNFEMGLQFAKERAVLAVKRLDGKDLEAELQLLKRENDKTLTHLRRFVRR